MRGLFPRSRIHAKFVIGIADDTQGGTKAERAVRVCAYTYRVQEIKYECYDAPSTLEEPAYSLTAKCILAFAYNAAGNRDVNRYTMP